MKNIHIYVVNYEKSSCLIRCIAPTLCTEQVEHNSKTTKSFRVQQFLDTNLEVFPLLYTCRRYKNHKQWKCLTNIHQLLHVVVKNSITYLKLAMTLPPDILFWTATLDYVLNRFHLHRASICCMHLGGDIQQLSYQKTCGHVYWRLQKQSNCLMFVT